MRSAASLMHARRVPDWRARRDLREWLRRPVWPKAPTTDRVAVVCASYNTRELVSHLIFSLHRVLPRGAVGPIVVVDNGSTDGSRETLQQLHDAGLIHLIANDRQRYHGPALNQAMSWLARRDEPAGFVWVLDSDCVVLRSEVVADAVAAMRAEHAALLGEHDGPKVALNSVLLDPAVVWRRAYPPFLDHGDPSIALQRALGSKVKTFPFRHGTYVLHLGRGTLSEVAQAGERDHPQFTWAVEHQQRTYGSHPFGERLHRAFLERYEAELDGRTLAEACAREERVVIREARPLPPLDEVARRFADGTLDELYDAR